MRLKILFILFFLVSCRSEIESSLEGTKNPPIKGQFAVVSLNTFYREGSEYVPVNNVYPINTSLMRAEFDLDHEGLGAIAGDGTCHPLKDATSTPNAISSQAAINALGGIFGLLGLILDAVDLVDCAIHGSKPRKSSVISIPYHSFFGGDRLPANTGFVGGPNRDDANPECRKLKFVRYVQINSNFIACIGFEDSQQNKLKMVQLKNGDVKAQRIQLVRVKK
ncbi:MAG: hypothetical protein WCI18_02150 [Pseudomonadota bacterium]